MGSQTGWANIVVQVHYKDKFSEDEPGDNAGIQLTYSTERPKYSAGIYLFASQHFQIAPGDESASVIVGCMLKQTVNVFATRVHAHSIGRAIGVFTFENGIWNRLVERSPQRPQAFYPINETRILENSWMSARCVYNASGVGEAVSIGHSRAHEMCNAYLMFYSDDPNSAYEVCTTPVNPSEIVLPDPDPVELAYIGDGSPHVGNPFMHHGQDHSHDHHQMSMTTRNIDMERMTKIPRTTRALSHQPRHTDHDDNELPNMLIDQSWERPQQQQPQQVHVFGNPSENPSIESNGFKLYSNYQIVLFSLFLVVTRIFLCC